MKADEDTTTTSIAPGLRYDHDTHPPTPYKYWAFISYSRRDMVVAKTLQKELERFHTPAKLRAEEGSFGKPPLRLRPIFLDQTDADIGETVDDEIKRKLTDSAFLIVLCSRSSAQSAYVNDEILHFLKLGRTNRILPLIVDSIANDISEVFPTSLKFWVSNEGAISTRAKNVLAADWYADGEKAAVRRIISVLLGHSYTEVSGRIDQHERRERRRLRFIAVSTSLAAVVAVAGTYVAVHQLQNARRVQSQYLAEKATQLIEHDRGYEGALVALEGLPSERGAFVPPNSPEALAALFRGLPHLRREAVLNGAAFAAFDSAGAKLLTRDGSSNTAAVIWNTVTWKPFCRLGEEVEHRQTSSDISHDLVKGEFGPGGKLILTAALDGEVLIWDAEKCAVVHRLKDSSSDVALFSPDGRLIATASVDGTAHMWSVTTGDLVAVLSGHKTTITAASFSLDSSRLATGSHDGEVRLWSTNSGKCLQLFRGHTGEVNSVEMNRSEDLIVTASDDNTARLWNVGTGKTVKLLQGHESAIDPYQDSLQWGEEIQGVNRATFSSDGEHVVTAGKDGTARVWNIADGKQVSLLQGHDQVEVPGGNGAQSRPASVNDVVFIDNGNEIITAADDGTARLWHIRNEHVVFSRPRAEAVLRNEGQRFKFAIISPEGDRIVTVPEYDRGVTVWNLRRGKAMMEVQTEVFPPSDHTWRSHESIAALAPNGKELFIASETGKMGFWDITSGKIIRTSDKVIMRPTVAMYSSDGSYLAVGNAESKVAIIQVASAHVQASCQMRSGSVMDLRLRNDPLIAIGITSTGDVCECGGASNQMLRTVSLDLAAVDLNTFQLLAVDPTGTLAVLGPTYSRGGAAVFDLATGKLVRTLPWEYNAPNSALFLTREEILVTSPGTYRVWDLRGGEEPKKEGGIVAFERPTVAAKSPDGQSIAILSNDGTGIILDHKTWKVRATFRHGGGTPVEPLYSPDGTLLLVLCGGELEVHEAADGALVDTRPSGIYESISHVGFNATGDLIFTTHNNGVVRIWAMPTRATIVEAACSLLPVAADPRDRNLSEDYRKRYFLESSQYGPCDRVGPLYPGYYYDGLRSQLHRLHVRLQSLVHVP